MAEKRDYYEALGLSKTATADEIKSACKRCIMVNHPDGQKNKKAQSDKEREAIKEIYTLALEAEKILLDPSKRAVYDTHGHKGLERVANNPGTTSSVTDIPVLKRTFSTEDTFSFFDRAKDKLDKEKANKGTPDDGLTSEQRREKAREERRKNRQQGAGTTLPKETSVTPDFNEVSEGVKEAAEKLRKVTADASGSVSIPLNVLVDFKAALDDLRSEVDKAIQRKKSSPGFNNS